MNQVMDFGKETLWPGELVRVVLDFEGALKIDKDSKSENSELTQSWKAGCGAVDLGGTRVVAEAADEKG